MIYKASIGSISTGTLRIEDLLDTFSAEIVWLARNNPDESEKAEHLKLAEEAENADPQSEEAGEILQEMFDALETYAPPYCYFGATESDGACFGFWPSWSAIDELPRIKDNSEEEIAEATNKDGDDCVFVNDHGNVTIYNAKGEIIFECV